jgi:hypothetical protein
VGERRRLQELLNLWLNERIDPPMPWKRISSEWQNRRSARSGRTEDAKSVGLRELP